MVVTFSRSIHKCSCTIIRSFRQMDVRNNRSLVRHSLFIYLFISIPIPYTQTHTKLVTVVYRILVKSFRQYSFVIQCGLCPSIHPSIHPSHPIPSHPIPSHPSASIECHDIYIYISIHVYRQIEKHVTVFMEDTYIHKHTHTHIHTHYTHTHTHILEVLSFPIFFVITRSQCVVHIVTIVTQHVTYLRKSTHTIRTILSIDV